MNLIKLYNLCGKPVYIDTWELDCLHNSDACIHIYTSHGNYAIDGTKNLRSIHINNIFASPELSNSKREAIRADMNRRAVESTRVSA